MVSYAQKEVAEGEGRWGRKGGSGRREEEKNREGRRMPGEDKKREVGERERRKEKKTHQNRNGDTGMNKHKSVLCSLIKTVGTP